jgi:hypothetical protein
MYFISSRIPHPILSLPQWQWIHCVISQYLQPRFGRLCLASPHMDRPCRIGSGQSFVPLASLVSLSRRSLPIGIEPLEAHFALHDSDSFSLIRPGSTSLLPLCSCLSRRPRRLQRHSANARDKPSTFPRMGPDRGKLRRAQVRLAQCCHLSGRGLASTYNSIPLGSTIYDRSKAYETVRYSQGPDQVNVVLYK